ncbi:C6 zinc finger protein [Colletotrichum higginsianum]|nr:C6 zinc finger protein [Colletotrichum higginsianum]
MWKRNHEALTSFSVGIITNTTCPRSHLETSAISHLEALDFMIDQYGSAMTPSQVWPPQLLAEVIKITHLRLQVTRKRTGSLERISEEAYETLDRIQGFSPEQLSESKASSREDWTCIGNVYKSAVALYCVLSLQSASVLPETPTLRASCAAHGQHLQHLLSTSLSSPRTRMFMFWPLILLGVEAVHGDATTRDFVSKHLLELSRVVGTSVPLTAQRVLASFWASGDQSWDACFDRPYPFTTQIAVDIGRVYAPRQRDLRDL